MSTNDIDIIAGTRRRAIVTKVLREEIPRHLQAGVPNLQPYVRIAAAVLLALDEETYEQAVICQPGQALSEHEIRWHAVRIAQDRLGQAHTGGHGAPDPAATLLKLAVQIAEYIRDGKVGE